MDSGKYCLHLGEGFRGLGKDIKRLKFIELCSVQVSEHPYYIWITYGWIFTYNYSNNQNVLSLNEATHEAKLQSQGSLVSMESE